ncbi:MAG: ABC transporter permease [Lachnospiraceae bacterium]|jgi:osmoprotectant transport system permease protein|nr:ABC transporter permease [Lachnospiraceae bacterium]
MITDIAGILIERKEWFLELLLDHVMLAGTAILLAGSIGLALGILINQYQKSAQLVLSLVNMLYTIPDIAMFGFLIPLTGIGKKTAVTALTVYALLPMIRNTYTGLCQVDADILEAATGMGSTKWQVLFRIQLPMAFSVILAGIRNMVVMVISIAGIASFIGAGGLGSAIYRGIATNNSALMIAGSILIALMAIAADIVFGLLEKHVKKRWKV